MADISKITLPSGTTYDIKDAVAREAISGYTKFLGVTTTALTDGDDTNPITINGQSVTASAGDIVSYGSKEFIFNGSVWQEFGDLGALGDMAYADTASGSGTVSGSVTLTKTGKTTTVSEAASGEATYTPDGSVSLTTTSVTPTISVDTPGTTGTIHNPTKQTVAKTVEAVAPGQTAPSNPVTYYSVANETLSLYQLGYTTGDSITTDDVTVKTGDASYESSAISVPSSADFTGTGARLVTGSIETADSASFSGGSVSVTVTPDE